MYPPRLVRHLSFRVTEISSELAQMKRELNQKARVAQECIWLPPRQEPRGLLTAGCVAAYSFMTLAITEGWAHIFFDPLPYFKNKTFLRSSQYGWDHGCGGGCATAFVFCSDLMPFSDRACAARPRPCPPGTETRRDTEGWHGTLQLDCWEWMAASQGSTVRETTGNHYSLKAIYSETSKTKNSAFNTRTPPKKKSSKKIIKNKVT